MSYSVVDSAKVDMADTFAFEAFGEFSEVHVKNTVSLDVLQEIKEHFAKTGEMNPGVAWEKE